MYEIKRSWRNWLELYNMQDGWNFRLALRERVLGSLHYDSGGQTDNHLLGTTGDAFIYTQNLPIDWT